MPDGTSRFSLRGQPVHHYMGCSTFANFTVLPGDRGGEDPRRRAVRKGLLHRLRRHDGHRRRHQHGEGRARRQRRRVRTGRHRPQRRAGRADGGRQHDRRRRSQPGTRGARAQVRHDAFREPAGRRRRPGGASGRAHARRRRLQLRVHRQRRRHAPGARMLPPRLGRVGDHRRRGRRPGNPHASRSSS